MKRLVITIFIFTQLALSVGLAQEGPWSERPDVADYMSCKEAIHYYAKYELIYVIIHFKGEPRDLVPIYGMKPAKKKGSCGHKSKINYKVDTWDTSKCNIAWYCSS